MLKKLTRFDESRFNEDIDVGITSKVNSGSHQIGEHYTNIFQNPATISLSRTLSTGAEKRLGGKENSYGDLSLYVGGVKVTIENYSDVAKGVRTSAAKLLDALILKFMERDPGSGSVELSLEEYRELRGVKDMKSLREQVKEDLRALYSITLEYNEIAHGKKGAFRLRRLAGDRVDLVRGKVYFDFSEPFKSWLRGENNDRYIMPYPKELFRKDSNSYKLLKFIAEHKRMNYHKNNSDIISVKKLLEIANEIPRYEELKKIGGITQKIVRPFERAMDNIEAFEWNYCLKGGKPIKGLLPRKIDDITAEERLEFASNEGVSLDRVEELEEGFKYSEIIELNVKIAWKNYPVRKKSKKVTNKTTK